MIRFATTSKRLARAVLVLGLHVSYRLTGDELHLELDGHGESTHWTGNCISRGITLSGVVYVD
jgi:hypothetical protein